MNKFILYILILFSLSCCTESTQSSKFITSKKDEIVKIEEAMLEEVAAFQRIIIRGEKDKYDKYKEHISNGYLEYISDQAGVDNADSLLKETFYLSVELINEMKENGYSFSFKMNGIKDSIKKDDTLIYLVSHDLIAKKEILDKKIITQDHILAISVNFGKKWYFYQPDIISIDKAISGELSDSLSQMTLTLLKKHQIQGVEVQ